MGFGGLLLIKAQVLRVIETLRSEITAVSCLQSGTTLGLSDLNGLIEEEVHFLTFQHESRLFPCLLHLHTGACRLRLRCSRRDACISEQVPSSHQQLAIQREDY